MKKQDLVDLLENSHAAILDLLDRLDEDQLVEPDAIGIWSVKDLLVHLTLWEAELITMLFQVRRGQTPSTLHFSQLSDDEINAQWYRDYRDRDLEAALDDYYSIRAQTIRRVNEFSDRDLFEPRRYRWAGEHPLHDWLAGSTYEHEEEHLPELKQYVERITQNPAA
ncbi:MAG: ClbS/DfsB family four-helix bundle protein [Anaerolineales bacterium]